MRRFLLLPFCLAWLLVACSNPLNAPVPKDLGNMESLKPAMEKLKPEEKELLAAYVVRHSVGAVFGKAFGVQPEPIPEGMTVGKALDEQRAFVERLKTEEAAKKLALEQAEAQRKALVEQMKLVLASRVIDITLHKATYHDGDVHSTISFEFEIDNKGAKDIAGIKGLASFRDKFGDRIAGVSMKTEEAIPAGKSVRVRLGKDYSEFNDNDRKLVNLDVHTATFELAPEVILFADGSKFESPKGVRE